MAQDALDTVLGYAHHETKLLKKLWKYINANHSSFRENLKGTSCATRHVLNVWISVLFPFSRFFPLTSTVASLRETPLESF